MKPDAVIVFGPHLAPDCKIEVTSVEVEADWPDGVVEISGSIDGENWHRIDPAVPMTIPIELTLTPFDQFMLGLLLDPTIPLVVDSNLRIDPDTGELGEGEGWEHANH